MSILRIMGKPAVKALAGELFVRGHGAGARAAVRVVFHGRLYLVAASICHQGGACQMVLMQILQVCALLHSSNLSSMGIVSTREITIINQAL